MRRPAGKPVRVRADLLSQDGDCLVLLPRGFRAAALAVLERLTWDKTWIDADGYNVALTDEQAQVVERGLQRMSDCMDIINNITVNDGDNNCGGCSSGGGGGVLYCNPDGGVTVTLPPDDGGETAVDPDYTPTPDGQIPPPAQDDFTDVAEWDSDQCRVAYAMPQILSAQLRELERLSDKATSLGVLLTFLAPLIPQVRAAVSGVELVIEVAQWLGVVFGFEGAADQLTALADEIDANVDAAAEAYYCNRRNAPLAHAEVVQTYLAFAAAVATDDTVRTALERVMRLLNPLSWFTGDAVRGQVEILSGDYAVGDCTAFGCAPTAPNQYAYGVAQDYQHIQGFAGGGTGYAWNGSDWVSAAGVPAPSYVTRANGSTSFGLVKVPYWKGDTGNYIRGQIDVTAQAGTDALVVQGWRDNNFVGVRVNVDIDGVRVRRMKDGKMPPTSPGSNQYIAELGQVLTGAESVYIEIAGDGFVAQNAFLTVANP